jgi:mercuric ion binding protein
MKNRIAALVIVVAALACAGAAQAKTIKMEVNGMVCAFCAQGIEKKLRAMQPTRDVVVSLENKVVAVALKDGTDISDATLSATLKDAGYDVISVTRVEEPLEAIRKSLKRK